MNVRVDLEACQGYACCLMEAPELFDLDDGGKAVVLRGDVPEELEAKARAAERTCPSRAITLTGE